MRVIIWRKFTTAILLHNDIVLDDDLAFKCGYKCRSVSCPAFVCKMLYLVEVLLLFLKLFTPISAVDSL